MCLRSTTPLLDPSRRSAPAPLLDVDVRAQRRGFRLLLGPSALALDLGRGSIAGILDEGFWQRSAGEQRSFFLLALAIVLHRHGLYGLHANGLVRDGTGVLVVGPSGSGKTTLTLGLVSQGWSWLADDALMLRQGGGQVEALAFRRSFACTATTFVRFPRLAAALPPRRTLRAGKRQVDLDAHYPGRFESHSVPRVLLFPEVWRGKASRLTPLDAPSTLCRLIAQSVGVKLGRSAIRPQLELLGALVRQTRSYTLRVGADVWREPAAVSELLWAARGAAG